MDDEMTAANPADEETVTPETQEAEPLPEAETEGGDVEETDELEALMKEATGSGEDNPDDLIEVEVGGKNYKVHPDLKDAFLLQSDYTKKTMTLADQRREVEAAKERFDSLNSLTTEQLNVIVQAENAKARAQAIASMGVEGLSQEELNSLRLDYQDAEREAQTLTQRAAHLIEQQQALNAQHFAKARDNCLKAASKNIPNFTEQRRIELETLAESMGASPGEMATVTDASVYRLLHLADIGQKFIERQRKATKVEKAQATAPVPEIGGKKATANKDPDKMSTEEWLKWRNAQIARR